MTSRNKRSSDSDFLDRQIKEASGALSRTLRETKSDLAEVSNPGTWVRQYPWILTGAAAVSASYLGWKLGWGRNERLKKKWSRFSRNLKASRKKPPEKSARWEAAMLAEGRKREERGGALLVLFSLLPPLLKAASPFLKTASSAALRRGPRGVE